MLTLSGKGSWITPPSFEREVFSISTNKDLPLPMRMNYAFLSTSRDIPEGFKLYLTFDTPEAASEAPMLLVGEEFSYLGDKDVVAIGKGGNIRSIYRASSNHNSLLLTEQCNHYCLMCSQPPKRLDDSWLIEEAKEVVKLIPRNTQSIGITGGEPTIYGDRLVDLLRQMKHRLPQTSVHLLSNGRRFSDINFTKEYASVEHHDLMVGIPIYSCDPVRHDYVVQASGAFDETILGVLNLKALNQKVEIRVVLHKQTVDGLQSLAEFIVRNLLFVDHVALMGLEMTGFTRANLDSLWIDPADYRDKLSDAVRILRSYGVRTSVYNHPLCLVNEDIIENYVKSISDWKNEFAPECKECVKRVECGGFFSSGIRHGYSTKLKPFISA